MNLKLIKNRKSKIGNSEKGFTLIELLIAILLVSVGLIGVIAFFSTSLTSHFEAKSELIAAGLVQEGTELVRNVVDYNYLNGNNWWKNLVVNSSASNSNCKSIDYSSLSSHDCITANHTQVCLDGSSRYLQGNSNCAGNTKTEYTRTLTISGQEANGMGGIDLNSGDCLKATVNVSWGSKTTTATDIICRPRQ